jgi:hypothetical protein
MLGMVLLGAASSLDGSPTQSRTYSASAYLRFQSGDFPDEQRLLLGLLQPTVTGLGFESLRFQVNAGGGAAEIDQVFTDLAPAIAYFSGNTLDLGSIVSWNGLLDLQLDLTTRRAGDGFVIETLFGSSTIGANVPLPASGWLLVTAITFAATRSRSLRRNLRRA